MWRDWIRSSKDCHRDHIEPVALRGNDSFTNQQYVHKACHAIKTDGKPHTSYGSDKHALAKSKRILSPKKKKQKISSRGFDQTHKRGVDGKVRKQAD